MNALSRACVRLAALALMLPAMAACDVPSEETSGLPAQAVRPTSTLAAPRTTAPAPTCAPFLPVSATLSPHEAAAIRSQVDCYLDGLVKVRAFSGSVLLARDGKVLVSKGYGMADVERTLPNTPQTQFRIASLTKAFTAISIMMLKERGHLAVSDPICKYLEDCPGAWQPVTLRHLLTHTSGIPDFINLMGMAPTTTLEEAMAPIRNKPIESQPGSSYRYSNSGYVLLGHVIEKVSGERYSDFVRNTILCPLGMQDSGFEDNGPFEHAATGYREVGSPVSYVFPPLANAAAGMISTVEDMYRWGDALHSNTLVSAASLNEMFTPTVHSYGYGWETGELPHGMRVEHDGSLDGFISYIGLFPDSKATIIVLSNYGLACATESMLANILFH